MANRIDLTVVVWNGPPPADWESGDREKIWYDRHPIYQEEAHLWPRKEFNEIDAELRGDVRRLVDSVLAAIDWNLVKRREQGV